MAKKSKTQRAKASAARAQRKAQAAEAASQEETSNATAAVEEKPKRSLFKKDSTESSDASKPAKDKSKKVEKKPAKKKRFQFFRDVKAEMRRVTWPTKQDVLRWSVVVVVALLFFGIGVAVLDNCIITPLLVAVSGLGA